MLGRSAIHCGSSADIGCICLNRNSQACVLCQDLRSAWDKLYFVFSTTRLFGVHPVANLRAIHNSFEKAKLTLKIMSNSPYLMGVMKTYEKVESLLAVLQDRVDAIQTCQVLPWRHST